MDEDPRPERRRTRKVTPADELGSGGLSAFLRRDTERAALRAADHDHLERFAETLLRKQPVHIVEARDRTSVELDDEITRLDACETRRTESGSSADSTA